MKKLLKPISLIVIMVFSLSFLVSCAGKEASNDIKTIRLSEVVRSIFYAPMYASISEGFFEEEGIKIELSTAQGADKTAQEVLSKNADIGFCGPEQIVYLYNQGREDHGVIFAQLTQKDGSFLVARNNDEFNWDDVKGKTIIGGRPGGMPEMVLEHVLKQKGLTPNKDVELITNLAFNATAGAFKTGTGDYLACFEPSGTMLEKEDAGNVIASLGKEAGNIAYTAFFATNEYLNQNKDTIEGFTNAIYKGQLWVENTSSDVIAKSIIDFFPGSDVDDLTKIINRYKEIDAFCKTPEISDDSLNNLFDIMEGYDKDLIKKRPPINEISTNEFSKKSIENMK